MSYCGIYLTSESCESFYDDTLSRLISIHSKEYPNDEDAFYDDGKYLERALTRHGSTNLPHITCKPDLEHAEIGRHFPSFIHKDAMDYEGHITNLLAYHKDEQPVKQLLHEETSMGIPVDADADKLLTSYLCCILAKCIPLYQDNSSCFQANAEAPKAFNGKRYMEDAFLDALSYIYTYLPACTVP